MEPVPTFILIQVSFDKPEKERLLIGELAAQAGVSADTLRHYERRGVLARPARSAKGYRLYPADALLRVLLVRRAISVGFTLKELAEIFSEREKGGLPCRKVRGLAAAKLADLEDRLCEMKILHAELGAIVADWNGRLAENRDGEPAELLQRLTPPKLKTIQKSKPAHEIFKRKKI